MSVANIGPGALSRAEAPVLSRTPAAVARDLVQLMKPRVTLLVVFPAMVGMHLAPGSVTLWQALSALLGTVLLVGSANTINCVIERESDAFMTRTRTRPLPAGRLQSGPATAFGLLLLAVALPLLVAANPATAALGLLAHAVYAFVYTPLKRRTAWSTFIGFGPGAMPALMGWAAVTGGVEPVGLALFALVFLWQIPHTLAIGFFRGSEYAAAGIRVVPNAVGPRATAWQMVITSLLLVPVGVAPWLAGVTGPVSAAVAAVMALAFAFQGARGLWSGTLDTPWARRVFFFSMAYLTVVLAVLAADKLPVG